MYKVYYIQHSCFLIEFEDRYLLFDYFDKDVIRDTVLFHGSLPQLSVEKDLYVFSSHSHKDHWWLGVLGWSRERENIKYILSKDIRLGFNYLKRNGYSDEVKKKIKFVSADNKFELDGMKIETLRSNDAGVAFVINYNGIDIYHAGDLSWWNFKGRGELYAEQYGREYKRALRHIENRHFDIAFVVLDPRMGEDGYYLGLDYFIKNIECDNIFPMHMWGDYSLINRFKNRPDISNLRDRIVDIDQENMVFEIEE